MKIRYKHRFAGDVRTVTVAEYVRSEILDTAALYTYGQVESLECELDATKELLLRLIKLFEDDFDAEDIQQLCDPSGHSRLEILEEDDETPG